MKSSIFIVAFTALLAIVTLSAPMEKVDATGIDKGPVTKKYNPTDVQAARISQAQREDLVQGVGRSPYKKLTKADLEAVADTDSFSDTESDDGDIHEYDENVDLPEAEDEVHPFTDADLTHQQPGTIAASQRTPKAPF